MHSKGGIACWTAGEKLQKTRNLLPPYQKSKWICTFANSMQIELLGWRHLRNKFVRTKMMNMEHPTWQHDIGRCNEIATFWVHFLWLNYHFHYWTFPDAVSGGRERPKESVRRSDRLKYSRNSSVRSTFWGQKDSASKCCKNETIF